MKDERSPAKGKNNARMVRRLSEPLIGLTVVVENSSNSYDIGIKGKVVDETRYTIIIKTKKGEKRIIKSNVVLRVYNEGNEVIIKGKNIVGRAFERIKK